MKTKYLYLPLVVIFSQTLFAQDNQQFVGTYIVQEICTEHNSNITYPASARDIIIKHSIVDTFDIQFKIGEYTLGSSVLNDTHFQTPQHTFLNDDGTTLYISGEGYVKKDSLFYYYSTGGAGGVFECTCKGINKNATSTILTTDTGISIISNLANDVLKLEIKNILSIKNKAYVRIYNANAVLVVAESIIGIDSLALNIGMLPSGNYIIRIESVDSVLFSEQFIKE